MARTNKIVRTEETENGGIIRISGLGEKSFDLRKSSDILSDMNKALMTLTKMNGGASEGAVQWFVDTIKSGQIILPDKHNIATNLLENSDNTASKGYFQFPGRMFTFLYRPKTKVELEYYDITPLIITLPKQENGKNKNSGEVRKQNILGINLHYIEPDLRGELIDKLLRLAHKKTGEDKPSKGIGHFRLNYDLLTSVRFAFSIPCIRSYDPHRIIGRPILIPSNQWANATALPFENFLKAKNRKIWVESRKQIKEFIKNIDEWGNDA